MDATDYLSEDTPEDKTDEGINSVNRSADIKFQVANNLDEENIEVTENDTAITSKVMGG
jgi:hypothetical protein